MKLGTLVQSKQALQRLAVQPLPARSAYKLQKDLRLVDNELKNYEEALNVLLERLGEKNEQGQMTIRPASENWEVFQKELNDLLGTEVDLPVLKLKIEEITCQVSAADLLDIDYLLEEEDAG